MSWPPSIGEPLPRGAEAWSEPHKWSEWILAARGHGREWERVLRVGLAERELIWEAIAERLAADPISGIRDLGAHGINCEVDVELRIAGRSARIRTVWNYERPGAAPRLVSAYPRL